MVYSFLISDLNSKIWFSSIFSFLEDACSSEKLAELFVKSVKKEYEFNTSVSNTSSVDFADNLIPNTEYKGIFNIKINDIQKPVVWHSYCDCLYILVCENTENRILAASTLFFLIRTLRDFLPKVMSSPTELVYKADVVSIIVNTFLPSGQLLFLNNQVCQQLIKDLQKTLK